VLHTVYALLRYRVCHRFGVAAPHVHNYTVQRGRAETPVSECSSTVEEFAYTLWAYQCLLLAAAVALTARTWSLSDVTGEAKPLAVSTG
jgi:hypothetical protein